MYVCLYIFYLFIIVYYTPKKRNRYMKASSSSSSRDSVPCYTIPHHTIFLLMVYIIYKNFPMLKIFSIIITINSTKKERRKQCCGATIKISFLFVSQLCYHFFFVVAKNCYLIQYAYFQLDRDMLCRQSTLQYIYLFNWYAQKQYIQTNIYGFSGICATSQRFYIYIYVSWS